jgi:hypothetical protein
MLEVESGISAEVIEARGYRSLRGDAGISELLRVGFADYQCYPPGILMPGYGVDGRNGRYQFRHDRPPAGRQKYETPADSGLWCDVSPALQRDRLRDPGELKILTEGIKKGDALVSHGYAAVSVIGTYGWKPEDVIRELLSLIERDSRWCLLFDSDAADNPGVYEPEYRLACLMAALGAHVTVVLVPAIQPGKKTGADELLVARGPGALDALIAASPTYTWRNPPPPPDASAKVERLEAQNRALRLEVSELREREGLIDQLAHDPELDAGDIVTAIVLEKISREPTAGIDPLAERRLYMERTAERSGVARSTFSTRVQRLARTGAYSYRTDSKTKENKKTGERTTRDASFITFRATGTDFLQAVKSRRYIGDVPRERPKKRPRGRSCLKHPQARLKVKTETSWICTACGDVVEQRTSERNPDAPKTVTRRYGQPHRPPGWEDAWRATDLPKFGTSSADTPTRQDSVRRDLDLLDEFRQVTDLPKFDTSHGSTFQRSATCQSLAPLPKPPRELLDALAAIDEDLDDGTTVSAPTRCGRPTSPHGSEGVQA